MSEKLTFDPNAMTIGDLEDFEEVAGLPLDKALKQVVVKDEETGEVVLGEPDPKTGVRRPLKTVELSAKSLKALVWVLKRMEDPAFTLDMARNVKVSELEMASPEDDAATSDPTDALS